MVWTPEGKKTLLAALVTGLVAYLLSGRRWSDEGRIRRRLKSK